MFDGFPIQLKGVSEGFRVPEKILTIQIQILYLGEWDHSLLFRGSLFQ